MILGTPKPARSRPSVIGALAWSFAALVAMGGLITPVAVAWAGAHFWSPPRVVLYGVVPVLLAVAALVVMRSGETARRLFLAYSLAFAAALLGAEAYARREAEAVLRTIPKPANDATTLRREGVRVYPHACGIDFNLAEPAIRLGGNPVQPLTGVSQNLLTPDAAGRERWRFSDHHGFNNPPGQWVEGAPVAVGDSFTFGADVPIGRGYVDRLRERTGPVVNLGCSGNGPLLELAALAEYGPLVRPRVVIWAYYEGNDLIGDLGNEQRSPILPRYLAEGFTQNLAAQQPALDDAIAAFLERGLPRGEAVRPGPRVARAAFGWQPSRETLTLVHLRRALGLGHKFPATALGGFREVLARAKDIAAGWGGQVVFVHLPAEPRYAGVLGRADAEAYATRVKAVASELGLPVIDLAPVFARVGNPRALFRGHYTEEGYALVADTIAEELARLRP